MLAPACKPAAITQHPPAHLPRGTRPFARRAVVGVRLGRRLAAGLTPQQAATAEGLGKSEVATLLAEPTFAGLVEADRALEAMPAAERRDRLAQSVIEDALLLGDVRAALFVLREDERGRDPAEVLADGVIAAADRAAQPRSASRTRVNPPARAPARPPDRAIRRAAGRLREAVLGEHAALHRATAPTPAPKAAPAEPAGPRPAPPAPAHVSNRRERRRQAALARSSRPPPLPPRR